MMRYLPFWWISFLLDLSKDAFGLVVLAMCTSRQFAVAFDFLLAAHITSLDENEIDV
jgi:hypothetical protein